MDSREQLGKTFSSDILILEGTNFPSYPMARHGVGSRSSFIDYLSHEVFPIVKSLGLFILK